MNFYRIDHEDRTFDITEYRDAGPLSNFYNFIVLASNAKKLRGNEYCGVWSGNKIGWDKPDTMVYALYCNSDIEKFTLIDRYDLPLLFSYIKYRSPIFDKVISGQGI